MLDKLRERLPFVNARPADGGESFLPEDYVRSRGERRANLISLSLFGVVMLCVVGAFFVTNRRWMSVRDQREIIDGLYQQQAMRIEQLKDLEEQRSEMIQKAEMTTTLMELVPRSVLLAELSRRLPSGMTVLELELQSQQVKASRVVDTKSRQSAKGVRSLSKDKKSSKKKDEENRPEPPRYRQTVTVEGVARRNDDIAEYLARLKESDLFESVELAFIKESKIADTQFRRFELVATINEDTDARELFFKAQPAQPLPVPEQLSGIASGFVSLFDRPEESE